MCINFTYLLYKVEIIFLQILLHYQHSFPAFASVALCRSNSATVYAEALKLYTHAVFQPVVVRETASLECILQGAIWC